MSAPAASPSPSSFAIGVALIALSFLIYPAYALIALLPLPMELRVVTVVLASLVSWGIFMLGTALAGKQGLEYLKRVLARRKAPPPI